ncbi:uncharacterized protein BDW70DRAFT_165864 [Aspergillus foveolatus]|uniref:uncharacterized protein n=1 Tax=Aspergillus foveolatus TaxID=210207 RepID=UPI003CCCB0AF
MPRQRVSSSKKLSPQEQHALIRKYGISIDGPLRRQDWPQRYAPLFGLVRDIKKVQYDDYVAKDCGGDAARVIILSNMCNRVLKIVNQARALRASLENEETWRLQTEHLILERFQTDLKYNICADRCWISDFQALSSCPAAASRLQTARQRRKLCQCHKIVRAKMLKKMLAHHRPDRVIGLGRTDGREMQVYFPFLVLEAKSKKSSVGFVSIERQTVFPIRAMLGLQQSLEAASSVQFDPLRVIDLWHGSILSHDSALQLLLVIGLLCDWARDILLEQIVSCLREQAGPDIPGLHAQTSVDILLGISSPSRSEPAGSSLDPPWATSELNGSWQSAQSVSTVPDVVVKSVIEDVSMDRVPEGRIRDILPEYYPEHIAIRSHIHVQLRFRLLSLPGSAHDLALILAAMDGEAKIHRTARKMLELFNPPYPFIVESHFIDRIGAAWGSPNHRPSPSDGPLLYACLHWGATTDYVDWVLTKEFANLLLSASTASTERAPRLIQPLRHLLLPELVQAASKDQFLYLKAFYGRVTADDWIEDREKAAFTRRLWECRDSQPRAFLRCHKNIYSIAGAKPHFGEPEHDIKILPMLRVPGIAKEREFALLRNPVEAKKPPYCVFEFNNRNDAEPNPPTIGRAVRSFLQEGSGCFYGTNLPLTALDKKYLAALSDILEKWD